MNTITLAVKGMMCEACVAHVTKALDAVPGVERSMVDLKSGQATVQTRNTDVQPLIDAVADTGYEAAVVDNKAKS